MLTKKDAPKKESKPQKGTKAATQSTQTSIEATRKTILDNRSNTPASTAPSVEKKNPSKTKITIRFDAGFSNDLYIRGKGADLKWEKGLKLVNIKHDEWVWETNAKFAHCEFKILINDKVYENGENHQLHEGTSVHYTPDFS
jgi:hypothetical protein